MKTLAELVKEMAGKTQLQQAEYAGAEVQPELAQIATDYLACVQAESPGPLMLVAHEGELLRNNCWSIRLAMEGYLLGTHHLYRMPKANQRFRVAVPRMLDA